MPYVLPYLVPCVLSCLVLFVLSCPTCLVTYVLSCLTCSRASRASSLRALVPYVLSCLTCLVPYVPCPWRALCLTCLVPYVFSCHTYLIYSCTSRVLCLACSRAANALNSACCCAPRPSLPSVVSSLTCSYAFHVL